MAWSNLPVPWTELQARLRGQVLAGADGNDAPAWSRSRGPYRPPAITRGKIAGAELHCHSNFSFLDGACHPETLVEEAARLGLESLALTDHDGFYGVVRFAQAAREFGIGTVFGAELSLDATQPRTGSADPDATHVLMLVDGPDGYARLGRAIADAQLAGSKGAPQYGGIEAVAAAMDGHGVVLTGCRKGPVTRALHDGGPTAATEALEQLCALFGRDRVVVELWDHGDPADSDRNDALATLAVRAGLRLVPTNNVHYARPADARVAAAMAALRARSSLGEMDGWLPVAPTAHLRSAAEQSRRFERFPGVVADAAALGRELAFDLRLVAPDLPGFDVPAGHTPMSWLRQLVADGAQRRYGARAAPPPAPAWRQIDHELTVIEQLDYPGYFLIVHDIVEFCVRNNILCQGRGSAANSAVCYVLGITKADAVALGLLFERFLSPHRDGPPDIDLDIESGRREEVIQYVYARYGRHNAAQVANVITYRSRSAVRDAGRALGYRPGQLDAWTASLGRWGDVTDRAADAAVDIPADVVSLANALIGAPRHLGIHSGGMVLCDRPIVEVCPIERARMPGRTVLQWDKDDCATAGLVKFDLLGLGMLSALHDMLDAIRTHHGIDVDLAELPQEPAVYDMLCAADAVGVFQVESRAQLATLPRLRPRTFYDLVVEVAIIRPGPIQGGSVHPYIRRRNGQEPVQYLHPLLVASLERTLGVPLFQEQLMQMAVDVAGLSAAEADQLRQAMGAKRSTERMQRLQQRLYDGMEANGVDRPTADRIYAQIAAFADFGFPESHAISFAYLVYASAWIKLHFPAAFLAGLLNNQPMGFYAPQTLVADARRHGVIVHRADVNRGGIAATLEPDPRSVGGVAVRLGLQGVRAVGTRLAERIVASRPYGTLAELVHRADVPQRALESLATAGACRSLADAGDRRQALWSAGAAAQRTADRLPDDTALTAPTLPGMAPEEVTAADLRTTGISPTSFPLEHIRADLDADGVCTIAQLADVAHGTRVRIAGVVTHRQQPATASGTVFVSLEDESGMANVICSPGLWIAHRGEATHASALVITGRVERAQGAINVVAQRLRPLLLAVPTRSRDFR
ncbi:MAG: error-prone DNA polymerase [Nitriliruptoraceae bacterium]